MGESFEKFRNGEMTKFDCWGENVLAGDFKKADKIRKTMYPTKRELKKLLHMKKKKSD